MDVSKIVFLGDSHVQGVGAEWPKLYGSLVGTPREFTKNIWNNYLKKTDDTEKEIYKKYMEITSNIDFDFNMHPDVISIRNKFSWPSIVAETLDKELVNYGFGAYNLQQIVGKLLIDSPTFEDSLVVLGVPNIKHELTFHNPVGTQQFQNITISTVAANIILIKEFVEARGGRFVYFHTEDYPKDFYNTKFNPYLYHLTDIRLFNRPLFSYLTPNFLTKKHDGVHYNLEGQKYLAHMFVTEFRKTLIFSILSS